MPEFLKYSNTIQIIHDIVYIHVTLNRTKYKNRNHVPKTCNFFKKALKFPKNDKKLLNIGIM